MSAPIWIKEWREALARARAVKAIPSAVEYPECHSPRTKPDSQRAERARRARLMEETSE